MLLVRAFWQYSGDLNRDYSGDLKSNHLKSGLFEGRISNGRAIAMAIAIRKLDHLKSRWFCPDFNWFLTKWWPFVWISNGWASRFQILSKSRPFATQPLFWPFEIQTSPDFRSQLKSSIQMMDMYMIVEWSVKCLVKIWMVGFSQYSGHGSNNGLWVCYSSGRC